MAFYKNHFPTIFGGHLEFLRKMQKHIYLEQDFGYHLQFWWKLKMSFVSKTLGDSDFEQCLDPLGTRDLRYSACDKSRISIILYAILNFGGN